MPSWDDARNLSVCSLGMLFEVGNSIYIYISLPGCKLRLDFKAGILLTVVSHLSWWIEIHAGCRHGAADSWCPSAIYPMERCSPRHQVTPVEEVGLLRTWSPCPQTNLAGDCIHLLKAEQELRSHKTTPVFSGPPSAAQGWREKMPPAHDKAGKICSSDVFMHSARSFQ